MVTTLEPRTQAGRSTGHRSCDGCPRCQDANAPWCRTPHPRFNNLHPVCKTCGHCVLRGRHQDDASDLDGHPGLGNGGPRINRN